MSCVEREQDLHIPLFVSVSSARWHYGVQVIKKLILLLTLLFRFFVVQIQENSVEPKPTLSTLME